MSATDTRKAAAETMEFYATEMTEAELDAQADTREFYLDEQGSTMNTTPCKPT